jgi:hypothetical protein
MELIMLFMFQFMEQWIDNACALMKIQIKKKNLKDVFLGCCPWFFSIEFLYFSNIFFYCLCNQN